MHAPALLEAIVEHAPVALVVSDATGRVVLFNRSAEQLFARSRADVLGAAVESLVPQALRQQHLHWREQFQAGPRTRSMGIGRDLHLQRPNGEQVPVEITLRPIECQDAVYVLAVVIDLSERCKLQQALQRSHDALEQRVRERTAELESSLRANARLLMDLQAKGDSLEKLSREDPLTGLSNRRDFDAQLDALIAAAQLSGSALCVAMLDLDHFKSINDLCGHACGDAVLRRIADVIRGGVPTSALAARYGGEEFALILPGCDAQRGWQVCEQIRLQVQAIDWRELHPAMQAGLSLSGGVYAWRSGLSGSLLLAEADVHLYAAKRKGRNRIIGGEIATEPPTALGSTRG